MGIAAHLFLNLMLLFVFEVQDVPETSDKEQAKPLCCFLLNHWHAETLFKVLSEKSSD